MKNKDPNDWSEQITAPYEPAESPIVPRMTEKELNQFVRDLDANLIFTSAHIRESEESQLLGMIFMPIGLGAFAEYSPEELTNIGAVFEYLDKAGPRAINGYPIFFSAHLIHKEDWEFALDKLKRLEAARNEVLSVKEEDDDEGS